MENFIAIPIFRFEDLKETPCALYLKLSEGKIVQVFKEKTKISPRDFEKYRDKGVEDIFIRSVDLFTKFDQKITSTLLKIDKAGDSKRYLEVLHDSLEDIGIKKLAIEHAEKVCDELRSKNSNKKLKGFFDSFDKCLGTFLYSHGLMTIIIASEFIKTFDWSTDFILHEVALAGMIHDLGFSGDTSHQSIHEISTVDGLGGLDEDNQRRMFSHPQTVLTKVDGIPHISEDVRNMISFHHYPLIMEKGELQIPSSKLGRVVCSFILCHQLVLEIFQREFDKEKFPEAISKIRIEFGEYGPFDSLLKGFDEKMFKILQLEKIEKKAAS